MKTGADVFSTPALADLNGDGALEVIVGSDDGVLRVLTGDGGLLWCARVPGQPFLSASPTIADLDADKSLEIALGAWDRRTYVWSSDGKQKTMKMPSAGHAVWSSATAFEIKRRGNHLTWASDAVYLASSNGTVPPGWPVRTGSWMVASPAVAELGGSFGAAIMVGSERAYAWDLSGNLLDGWPVDCGDFIWSSPIVFDVDGDGMREVVIGSWDGRIHALRPDGSSLPGFPLVTDGPIFATPAASPLRDGGGLLVGASWDGTIRGWWLPAARFAPGDWLQFRGSAMRLGSQTAIAEPSRTAPKPAERPTPNPVLRGARVEPWHSARGIERIVLKGENLAHARDLRVVYGIGEERKQHPVPVVNSRSGFVAMVQPLRIPHRIRYSVEFTRRDGTTERWPPSGSAKYLSQPQVVTRLRGTTGKDMRRARIREPETT